MKIKDIGKSIINNWPVKILSVAMAVLLFYFYRLNTTEEHNITVPLEIILNNDFVAADTYPSEVKITLRGSSESFFLINEKDITAHVDFSSKEKSGYYREPITVRKKGNALYADPLEIKVIPTEIRLKIEEKLIKSIPVVPVIKRLSSENYKIISTSIIPENVTLEGPLSIVEKITSIKTEEISIENIKERIIFPVRLEKINDLIKIVEGDEVHFYGIIEKNLISKNIAPIEIDIRGKKDDFVYAIDFNTGSITLEAERDIINLFNNENCSLYVDLLDIDIPGIYNLPVIVSLAGVEGKVAIVNFAPETISVNVTIRGR